MFKGYKDGRAGGSCAQQHGVLPLRKPSGPTSAACVGLIKRRLGQKKVGHAGTLDPLAEGVLLILLGQATKIAGPLLEGGEKVYSGVLRFGLSTDTWDAQGRITAEAAPRALAAVTPEALAGALAELRGELRQEVPPYSAAKHQGRPLYELARRGLETPLKIKTVKISRAELEWFRPPLARIRVACGSGVYIRSLAHSLGKRFECGATLMELTREYSHPFGLEHTVTLDELLARPALLAERVCGLPRALPQLPALRLEEEFCRLVRNGRALPAQRLPLVEAQRALLLDAGGAPLALARRAVQGARAVWVIERGLWNN